MAINKKTQKIIQIIAPIKKAEELEKIAKKNHRSISAQALTYIEKGMNDENTK